FVLIHKLKQTCYRNQIKNFITKLQQLMKTKHQYYIAITGESGSGKSINALGGIRNKPEGGAAPTGAVETTMVATEYPYPEHPNIRIWDLPGIGTVKFTANKYIKKMEFKKYDFFMIVSSERFTENDAKLAKEIQKMKKKFYFVRSKIDNSISSQPRRDPDDILKSIRDNCTEELEKLGVESPKVFLVSGLKLHLYDFEDLRKTLMEDLPEHQRDVKASLEIINEYTDLCRFYFIQISVS
uniref:IRG-type G domain-containing protein n=1 Tax=Neogobius melanostomus TaxID=47308 RepID=A0A8C6TMP0_9GOBI